MLYRRRTSESTYGRRRVLDQPASETALLCQQTRTLSLQTAVQLKTNRRKPRAILDLYLRFRTLPLFIYFSPRVRRHACNRTMLTLHTGQLSLPSVGR